MLYRSCYSFLGTEDQLAIALPDPNLIVAITLTRGWQEFGERDRLLMNLMRPHIVQGLRNAQSFDPRGGWKLPSRVTWKNRGKGWCS